VAADQNVLAVALAAGIPLPHSCRQGHCASCRARLISGEIAYPLRRPPGLTANEAAAGGVLLCQAQPRSDLVVETRRVAAVTAAAGAGSEIVSVEPLPFGALNVELRLAGAFAVRPGQFVDVINDAGLAARWPVIAASATALRVEAAADGSELREWLDSAAVTGRTVLLKGPFDTPR
jgi:CDP-4-dehydro-6-deoxyglucose reductase